MSLEEKKLSNLKPCILLAAGGTGGHLLPAQMVGQDLLEKNCHVVFAAKGLSESAVFDRKRFEFYDVSSSSIRWKNVRHLFSSIHLLFKGVVESLKLLSSLKPKVVVGFGSYHSFPLLFATYLKKIPMVIFQPDCSLGKVNRFFAKKADCLALQFPLKKPLNHTVYVPLLPWKITQPIPSKEEARDLLGLKKDLLTFLIFGGSQGAKAINETILPALEMVQEHGIAFQIIHLTGEDSESVQSFYKKHGFTFYVQSFERNMIPLFQAADLAICRSGASTCGELISFELPFLLIPYPYAGGHQAINAQYMQDKVQGGEMVLQENMTPFVLYRSICQKTQMLAYHKEKIKEFKKARASLRVQTLCEVICEVGGVKI